MTNSRGLLWAQQVSGGKERADCSELPRDEQAATGPFKATLTEAGNSGHETQDYLMFANCAGARVPCRGRHRSPSLSLHCRDLCGNTKSSECSLGSSCLKDGWTAEELGTVRCSVTLNTFLPLSGLSFSSSNKGWALGCFFQL